MTCKDCLYSPMCEYAERHSLINEYCDMFICSEFEDKSQYIKLPCKVGDTVYINFSRQPIKYQIASIIIEAEHTIIIAETTEFVVKKYAFYDTDVNKVCFLTREEVEKALEEAEKK